MDAQERYVELADDLAHQRGGVTLGKLFRMSCIKADGRAVAGFWRDSMVFKLADAAVRGRALGLPGAALFEPMEGRPVHARVIVPTTQADAWAWLADAALPQARWLNHPPRSSSRKTTAFSPVASTTSK